MAVSNEGLLVPPPPVCLKLVGKPMRDLSIPPFLAAPAEDDEPPKRSFIGLVGLLMGLGADGPPLMPADEMEAAESLRPRVGKRARDLFVGLPGGEEMLRSAVAEAEALLPLVLGRKRGENILVGEGERYDGVCDPASVSEPTGGKSLLLIPLVERFRKRVPVFVFDAEERRRSSVRDGLRCMLSD